jgi:cell shape-determining protein MreC
MMSSDSLSQFEDKYGSISDDELLASCPSRYISTQSEKMRYLKDLAEKDIQAKKEFAEKAKDAEEKAEYQRQENEFRDKFRKLFGD